MQQFAALAPVDDAPRFGYALVANEELVGALLLISSNNTDRQYTRCNLSSWYVRPAYRAYAPLLVARAVRNGSATYVNISPATHTLPIIGAQGFVRATTGCFAGLPALSAIKHGVTVSSEPDQWQRSDRISSADERLLRDHAALGCISLWIETPDGGCPFVFRRRVLRLGRLPCAMLLYCRSLEHLESHAGPIGRALLRAGLPLMIAGADRPLRGIVGKHFPEKMPIYYKGAEKPRASDLSYTEAAVFGI